MTAAPAVPAGTRLLHIGPHKTGTTTVQAAFHNSRESLTRQGVHYAGRNAHPMAAAIAAATGRDVATARPGTGIGRWRDLLTELDESDARVSVISSEFFCEADGGHIRSIVTDLDASRLQVVVTLRPIVRILASQWQQFMQNRMDIAYEVWLDAMLNHSDDRSVTPSFWLRHRHDLVIRRWLEVVGPERVTAIVVDESDKRMLLSSFESLLGIAEQTLQARDVVANRSLTYAEAELLRAFNKRYLRRGWSAADYTRFVRFGAARHLQERSPLPNEEAVLTPQWAVDRGVEIATRMVEDIASMGVHVVGDLEGLTHGLSPDKVGDNPTTLDMPVEVAARFAGGLVKHLDAVPHRDAPAQRNFGEIEAILRRRTPGRAAPSAARRGVDDLRSDELLALLTRRVVRRLRRSW